MLRILQWNANGIKSKKSEFEHFIFINKIDIFVIQESWLQMDDSFQIKNFNIIRSDRLSNRGGGTLIGLRKIYSFVSFQHITVNNSLLEKQHISINIDSTNFDIINLYHPTGKITKEDILEFSSLNKNYIILGDVNCHHTIFGSYKRNKGGEMLMKWFNNNSACFLNRDYSTHVHKDGTSCVLDLSFCSPLLFHKLEWNICSNSIGSDHFPIIIELKLSSPNNDYFKNLTHYINWKKVQFDVKNLGEFAFSNYENYINHVKIILQKNSFYKYVHYNHINWWTSECQKAVAQRRKSFDRARHFLSEETWIQYKKDNSLARRTIIQAKRNAWKNFLSTLKGNQLQKIYNVVKSQKLPPISSKNAILIDNSLSFNSQKQAEAFGDFFSSQNNSSISFSNGYTPISNVEINKPFSFSELQFSIKNSKNTAPGLDGISIKVLQFLQEHQMHKILQVFNNIWETGILPKDWKIGKIVPILKPGKDPTIVKSYRQITLTSIHCKIQERMILRRLQYLTYESSFFHNNQFGFIPGKGSLDCIASIIQSIQNARSKHLVTYLCSIDLKQAYDSINHELLLQKIFNVTGNGFCFNWMRSFISNRSFVVHWNNFQSRQFNSNRGVIQGSVLSPILFNIYMRDIFNIIPEGSELFLYADDIFIITSHIKQENSSLILKETIGKILQWCERWHLSISPEKSNLMNCSTHRDKCFPEISINNIIIPWSTNIRILGLIVQSNLKWNLHFKSLQKKGGIIISILKQLSNSHKGPSRRDLILLLQRNLLPVLEYGSPIFGQFNCSDRKKLNTIVNSAVRIITGLPKACPIDVLYAESGMYQLFERFDFLSLRFYLKKFSYNNNSPFSILCSNYHDSSASLKIHPKSLIANLHNKWIKFVDCNVKVLKINYYMPHWEPDKKIQFFLDLFPSKKENISSIEVQQRFLELFYLNWSKSINIFTDGSEINGQCGFGIYIPVLNVSTAVSVPSQSSIFTAESSAIEYSILHYCNQYQDYCIFSDCKASIIALKHCSAKSSHITISIKKTLETHINKVKSISFIWIPSHCGIEGNEIADKLAKEGANNFQDIGQDWITASDYGDQISEKVKNQSVSIWNRSKYSSKFSYIDRLHPWLCDQSSSRKMCILISKLRTETAPLNSFLCKIKSISSPNCNQCKIPETTEHYIIHCNRYIRERSILQLGVPNVFESISINVILLAISDSSSAIDLLEKYIKKTGRFNGS